MKRRSDITLVLVAALLSPVLLYSMLRDFAASFRSERRKGSEMMTWREREDRIEARGAEYRASAMSEEQFLAYLFSMGVRGEDIRSKLADYAPAASGPTWEDARLEASRKWLQSYAGKATESHDRQVEAAIVRFRECGVDLDRMRIVFSRNFHATTLYVDNIARFTWKLEKYLHGKT